MPRPPRSRRSTQPRRTPPCTDPGRRGRREDRLRAATPGETQTGLRVRQVAVCAFVCAAKEKKHKLVFTKQERAKRLGTGCAAARVPSTEPGLQCNDVVHERTGAGDTSSTRHVRFVPAQARRWWVCRLVRRANGRSPSPLPCCRPTGRPLVSTAPTPAQPGPGAVRKRTH